MKKKGRPQTYPAAGCVLTARQAEVLACIDGFAAHSGYPPSLREAATACGVRGHTGLVCHLRALKKKGFVRVHGTRRLRGCHARGLEIVRRRDGDRVLIRGAWYRAFRIADLPPLAEGSGSRLHGRLGVKTTCAMSGVNP